MGRGETVYDSPGIKGMDGLTDSDLSTEDTTDA